MNADDCRLLCEKMGKCWHIPVPINSNRMRVHYRCGVCKTRIRKGSAITFTTVPECWDVMQWAFGQEWWEEFYYFAWYRYAAERHRESALPISIKYESMQHDRARWLLRDPAHLPELVIQYGREVLGWTLKEKGE